MAELFMFEEGQIKKALNKHTHQKKGKKLTKAEAVRL